MKDETTTTGAKSPSSTRRRRCARCAPRRRGEPGCWWAPAAGATRTGRASSTLELPRPGLPAATTASVFRTVEIDATFYAMPRAQVVENWARRSPPGLRLQRQVPPGADPRGRGPAARGPGPGFRGAHGPAGRQRGPCCCSSPRASCPTACPPWLGSWPPCPPKRATPWSSVMPTGTRRRRWPCWPNTAWPGRPAWGR